MTDREIVTLYWSREQAAIQATDEKYGTYCYTIADNILRAREDCEECVNDTWLRTWNALPPQKPERLRPFLGKITRNLAFDRWRALSSAKRGGGELPLALEELGECCSGSQTENEVIAGELAASISRFLRTLSPSDRGIFLRRYFYVEPTAEIARKYGLKHSTVRVTLHRTREKLRTWLRQEGFDV